MTTDIVTAEDPDDLAASVELYEQPLVEVLAFSVSLSGPKLECGLSIVQPVRTNTCIHTFLSSG